MIISPKERDDFMTIETLNNYKIITADENKVLVLPDETLEAMAYLNEKMPIVED